MNHNNLSEPGDYYDEVDGEVLPPKSEPEIDDISPSDKAEIVARAFLEKNDQLTREVFPSDDMEKAYQVARRLLELNTHEFTPNDDKLVLSEAEEILIDGTTIEKGQRVVNIWYTDKRTNKRKNFKRNVAIVIRVRDGKKIYLASDNKIPEHGASKFLLDEWDQLEKRIDQGEGTELKNKSK